MDHLVQRLQILRDKVQSTEKFIDAELDHRRNELVSLDIFVTAITMGFSFVACVGGVFGARPGGCRSSQSSDRRQAGRHNGDGPELVAACRRKPFPFLVLLLFLSPSSPPPSQIPLPFAGLVSCALANPATLCEFR